MSVILDAIEQERETIRAAIAVAEERLGALDELEGEARRLLKLDPAPTVAKVTRSARRSEPRSEPTRALPPPRRTQPPPQQPVAARRARLVALVREMEPVAVRDLVDRYGLPYERIRSDLCVLRDEGVLRCVGQTSAARWHLTETLDREVAARNGTGSDPKGQRRSRCREDVLATIRDEPGKWSEQRMADSGAWDRELVAVVCGELLDEGLVELAADAMYSPALALTA